MKLLQFVNCICIFFISCNDQKKIEAGKNVKPKLSEFFPVTDYIKGQIFEIKNGGINPLKIIISNNHPDSSWLKMDMLDAQLKDFLTPQIDSANLLPMFAEAKFMDQTLNAVTLSYDAKGVLPDSIRIRHWDVYIDPENGHVKSIYMVKNLPGDKTEQLTWISNRSCSKRIIANSSIDKSFIETTTTIQWSF